MTASGFGFHLTVLGSPKNRWNFFNVKIGNAVPVNTARELVKAALTA